MAPPSQDLRYRGAGEYLDWVDLKLLQAAQHLAAHGEHIEVTLIDEKEYFEFTPGIFRCFINPHHISDLTCAVDASLGRMVRGHVKDVEDGQARTAQGPRGR